MSKTAKYEYYCLFVIFFIVSMNVSLSAYAGNEGIFP
jgi:hypothetical protein